MQLIWHPSSILRHDVPFSICLQLVKRLHGDTCTWQRDHTVVEICFSLLSQPLALTYSLVNAVLLEWIVLFFWKSVYRPIGLRPLRAEKYNPIKRRYFVNKLSAWCLLQSLFCIVCVVKWMQHGSSKMPLRHSTVTVDVTKHTWKNAWHLTTMFKGKPTGPTQGLHYEAGVFGIWEQPNNKRVTVNGWLIISHVCRVQ